MVPLDTLSAMIIIVSAADMGCEPRWTVLGVSVGVAEFGVNSTIKYLQNNHWIFAVIVAFVNFLSKHRCAN